MSDQQLDEKYPMQWWLTWGLEVVSFRKDCEPEVFHTNKVDIFRMPFASKDAAYVFAAEIQRFLGDLYLHSTVVSPERLARMIEQVVEASIAAASRGRFR